MLIQRQEAEREMNEKIQKLHADKQAAVELAAALQRTLTAVEVEKRRAGRSAVRLHRDNKAVSKVERLLFNHYMHWRGL